MKDLTGKKVLLNPAYARWHLDRPEVYGNPPVSDFDIEVQMHMMSCMGVPMLGQVTCDGRENCWGIEWWIPGTELKTFYFTERRDFTVIHG